MTTRLGTPHYVIKTFLLRRCPVLFILQAQVDHTHDRRLRCRWTFGEAKHCNNGAGKINATAALSMAEGVPFYNVLKEEYMHQWWDRFIQHQLQHFHVTRFPIPKNPNTAIFFTATDDGIHTEAVIVVAATDDEKAWPGSECEDHVGSMGRSCSS
ncbi:Abhydrolase domain containing 18 protein [Raphanus sativus]|nr:Abhydrolase domain containing 18 protein [Raphanus sativus]